MTPVEMLLDAVRREVARQVSDERVVKWGTVKSLTPLRVLLPGDTTSVRVGIVGSYVPTVGDRVALLKVGAGWFAAGVLDDGS